MKVHIRVAVLATCLLVVGALALAGCGGGTARAPSQPAATAVDSQAGVGTVSSSAQKTTPEIEGVKGKTPEQKSAATEAVHCAADANPGSSYKVKDIGVCEGWARVSLEESGVPREEAIGFAVYLRQVAGKWEMVKSGTDITKDDLPDAPKKLFESGSK